jgi:hypothetical protein
VFDNPICSVPHAAGCSRQDSWAAQRGLFEFPYDYSQRSKAKNESYNFREHSIFPLDKSLKIT